MCVTSLVSRQRGQPLALLVAVQHQDFRLAMLAALCAGRWVERKQGLRLGSRRAQQGRANQRARWPLEL